MFGQRGYGICKERQKAVAKVRKHKNSRMDLGRKTIVINGVKGALIGIIFTIVCLLILAVIIKQFGVPFENISVINQIIKVVAVILCALIASKGAGDKTILSCAMASGLFIVLSFLIFSLLEGQFGDAVLMLVDLAMAIVIGIAIGVIVKLMSGKKTEKMASARTAKK